MVAVKLRGWVGKYLDPSKACFLAAKTMQYVILSHLGTVRTSFRRSSTKLASSMLLVNIVDVVGETTPPKEHNMFDLM